MTEVVLESIGLHLLMASGAGGGYVGTLRVGGVKVFNKQESELELLRLCGIGVG